MTRDTNNKLGRSLCLLELLFSLNVGFAIAFALFAYNSGGNLAIHASKPVRNFLQAFFQILNHVAPLISHLPRSVLLRNSLVWEIAFVAAVVGLALLSLVVLRIVERTPCRRLVLEVVAGITAVLAVPACWLYIVQATWSIYDTGTVWGNYGYMFVLEIAVVGVALYFARGRAPLWGILAFLLHYIFWVFVIGRRSGPSTFGSILISVVFPCSGIAWLAYVRQVGRRAAML
jgi:hypothetical protein